MTWTLRPSGFEGRNSPREMETETLRGIAIVLMVAGHVVGNTGERGMRVADDSAYRLLVDSLIFLRMPLFTVISGYVYAMRPAVSGQELAFLGGKAQRLLTPFVTVSTLQMILKSFAPNVNDPASLSDLWRIYLYPLDQFWFIPALAGIFSIAALLDGRAWMSTLPRYLVCLGLGALVSFYFPRFTLLFAFPGTLYLLPYFLVGIGLKRFAATFASVELRWIAAVAFTIAFATHISSLLGWWGERFDAISFRALVIGAAGSVCLFALRLRSRWLSWLGSYAYSIYLLHVIPMSASRIVLHRLGIEHDAAIFAVGLGCGVLAPIVVDGWLRNNEWTAMLVIGSRPPARLLLLTDRLAQAVRGALPMLRPSRGLDPMVSRH